MNWLPHEWLRSIRRRPAEERRILAVTTYISVAAIIIALWITSLARTITDFAAPSPGTAGVSEESSSQSFPDLATPFQTLRGGLREALSGFSQLFEEVNSLQQPQEPGTPGGNGASEGGLEVPATPAASSLLLRNAGATSTAATGERSGGVGDFLIRKLKPPENSPDASPPE